MYFHYYYSSFKRDGRLLVSVEIDRLHYNIVWVFLYTRNFFLFVRLDRYPTLTGEGHLSDVLFKSRERRFVIIPKVFFLLVSRANLIILFHESLFILTLSMRNWLAWQIRTIRNTGFYEYNISTDWITNFIFIYLFPDVTFVLPLKIISFLRLPLVVFPENIISQLDGDSRFIITSTH